MRGRRRVRARGRGRQDFTPRIFLAESDFLSLTAHQALRAPGRVDADEFEALVRAQLKLFTQVRLSSLSDAWSPDADFATIGALKHILLAQISAQADQDLLHAKLERLLAWAGLPSPAAGAGVDGTGQERGADARPAGGKRATMRRLSLGAAALEGHVAGGAGPVRAGLMGKAAACFSEGGRDRI